ncbi:MAG: endopeptidase La [Actinomycetota bacterium]
MVVTIAHESDEGRAAVEAAERTGRKVLLVPRTGGRYARVGTVAKLEDRGSLSNGVEALVVRGLQRAVIDTGVPGTGSAVWVQTETSHDSDHTSERAHELARTYRATIENILELRGAQQVMELIRNLTEPGAIADTAGYSPDLSLEQKIEVLETTDVEQRLEKVLEWARETLAEAELKNKIRSEVSDGMERQQREFLLRQQLNAIRKELGEDSDGDIVEEYRAKIEAANMPETARKEAERELGRLERASEQSPEHGMIRTFLDWMVELPWDVRSDDKLEIGAARRVLDADHTGLGDVKDRIVEYLAVRKLRAERGLLEAASAGSQNGEAASAGSQNGEAGSAGSHERSGADSSPQARGSGAILTLVGPPGVGKTSLGESVARALGRKFVRVSLGGVHDEAEIRGHRRTYIGALPGRIVRALKEAGTKNPVFMLDEIDKVGSDWRGDPSSALLEVLDPAQNHTFRDHYLEVDLDLSEVLFIATANVAEAIPAPLLDRMELIRLDGYIEDEKVEIARDHLLRRQLERNGLLPEEIELTPDALHQIVRDYTREAGVRHLERELGKVLRKAATRLAAGEVTAPVQIDEARVRDYLGRPKFFFEAAERTSVPGVATGLAVTGVGGDVLFVEATTMDGEPGLTLTGQLGDVMKESAQIALSFVRSHGHEFGITGDVDRRFHVHVPAGAVPKDGPSAGVTMTTALVSLLSGRPVKPTLGMTGEVTLQGKVLPIGGVKQKVLAAHRAGLTEVILPKRNGDDLDDVPAKVREEMRFHLVEDVHELLALALVERAGVHEAA